MTDANQHNTTLYWISGSPPSWRVMLALLLKNVPYHSKRLDHSKRENRSPEYLAINPRGQVPTLRHNGETVRESIAILAYVDRAFGGPALFGDSPAEAASVWQTVMDFENNLRPCVTTIAQTLLRGRGKARHRELDEAGKQLFAQLDALNEHLPDASWMCGKQPSAADCWLYPSIAWIERAAKVSAEPVPENLDAPLRNFANLLDWRARVEALDGFETTIPPHWKNERTQKGKPMFTYHQPDTAPVDSKPLIDASMKAYGFFPKLHQIMAEAPATYKAYLEIFRIFAEETTLSTTEQHVVMQAVNYENRCHYCTAGHSMLMQMAKIPEDVIDALREGKPIADVKLEALRVFTRQLIEGRGHIGDDTLKAFLDKGYTKRQALEVLTGIATKTLSNFTNALAHTELDEPVKPFAWTHPGDR